MSANFNCPSCHSDATQRFAVIYEGGIAAINTSSSTSGVGVGRGGLAVGTGRTKTSGVSQTAASQRAAPPSKKAFLKPLMTMFVVYLILSLFGGDGSVARILLCLGWIAASVGWVVFAIRFNTKIWPDLKAAWDKSFLCNRCNHAFYV